MKATTLNIKGKDLVNNTNFDITLKSSNIFILEYKFRKLDNENKFYIESWNMEYKYSAGNNGLNASSHLFYFLDKLN
jgi:hypothetical protein